MDLILCDGQSARSDSQYKANQCTKQGRMVPSGGVRTCGGAMLLQFQFCSGEWGGLDIVDEFYTDEPKPEQYQQKHVLDIQKGLQQSVRVVN